MRDSGMIAALARAAEQGGAVGVRVNGEDDIVAVRRAVALPIIGLRKIYSNEAPVYITPRYDDAQIIAQAGADIIAVDATGRSRPGGEQLGALISRIRTECGRAVMADVATFDEGVRAAALGADLVSTTLSGYTDDSPASDDPDIDLVQRLAQALAVPVVAEGRYRTPAQVREALRAGAFAVVVGRAITDPVGLTQVFAEAVRGFRRA